MKDLLLKADTQAMKDMVKPEQVTIRIHPLTRIALKKRADNIGISLNGYIEALLKVALEEEESAVLTSAPVPLESL